MDHESGDTGAGGGGAHRAGAHEDYVAPRAEDVGAAPFPVEVAPGAAVGNSVNNNSGTRT
jgi:hypothetical protein